MADEEKTQDTPGDKGPQPGVDPNVIRQAVGEALANWTPPQPEAREPAPTREPQPSDPLADLIGSRVNPALRTMGYEIADAKDAAMFYVENPEALKHKQGVEQAFNTLKAQGTPMARVAVWDWYKGKNFEKFRKEANEESLKAAERAKDVADMGPGGARRREIAPKDPHSLTDEDLAKAMEGVAF